jgi:hypothetical protein
MEVARVSGDMAVMRGHDLVDVVFIVNRRLSLLVLGEGHAEWWGKGTGTRGDGWGEDRKQASKRSGGGLGGEGRGGEGRVRKREREGRENGSAHDRVERAANREELGL